MFYKKQQGIPRFECFEYTDKMRDYVVLIPVINEGNRIRKELERAFRTHVADYADLVICDGDSTDGCTEKEILCRLKVNTLLVKKDVGKQGSQLRMGIWWALQRGYKGIITIDGNNKDSIEDVPCFIKKLEEGYDFVQGSRFIEGGKELCTPLLRKMAIKWIHAPVISITSHQKFTDTTNAFRAYSSRYLRDENVQPFRDIFMTYELLAYLSVRATQLGYKACEIPVTRVYPRTEKVPTKIRFFRGNMELIKILFKNFCGAYNPN